MTGCTPGWQGGYLSPPPDKDSPMPHAMTTAERRGYQQICGAGGMMLAVAADQRGGMRKLLASSAEGEAAIDDAELGRVKAGLVRHLGNAAACILLDATCAVPAVVDNGVLARDTALLIGLDASGWDTGSGGARHSKLVPDVTARRVRELGATGGKIMVYLRADRPEANARNLQILRDCIADFAAEDLLLVVEFLTYRMEGEAEADYAPMVPDLVVEGTRLCLDLGAKVLKLPYPGSAEACAEVTALCAGVPWAVLSAGVDHDTFLGQVRIALENGASGVIAGRALWKDCLSLDAEVQAQRLRDIALPRLREIEAILDGHAGRD